MEKILDQDLQDYRFLSNLRLLEDGRRAVLACARADLEQNSYPTDLYLLNLENGQKRRLTGLGDASSFAPWGENSVIFPAVREEADKKKIAQGELLTVFYEIAFDGGEAKEAFRLPLAGASAQRVRPGLYLIRAVHDNARPDLPPWTRKPAGGPGGSIRKTKITRSATKRPSGSTAEASPTKSATGCGFIARKPID